MSSTNELLFGPDRPEDGDLRIAEVPSLRRHDSRRYSIGLERIDSQMSKIHPGELVVIGAREGQGKTSLVTRAALANSDEHRVLFKSFDMPTDLVRDQCLAKLLSCDTDGVHMEAEKDSEGYRIAMNTLRERDFMISRPRKRADRTVKAITKHAEDVSAAILIIDYARLITDWTPGTPAAAIVDYLADWAHDSHIATFLLTQLRDEAVAKRPHNGHIQDTSQIAQRADRILLVWRPYLGNPRRDTVAEITCTKNRKGNAFRGHAHWIGSTTDFFDMSEEEEANVTCCRSR